MKINFRFIIQELTPWGWEKYLFFVDEDTAFMYYNRLKKEYKTSTFRLVQEVYYGF